MHERGPSQREDYENVHNLKEVKCLKEVLQMKITKIT
jgi:hypothetical protein